MCVSKKAHKNTVGYRYPPIILIFSGTDQKNSHSGGRQRVIFTPDREEVRFSGHVYRWTLYSTRYPYSPTQGTGGVRNVDREYLPQCPFFPGDVSGARYGLLSGRGEIKSRSGSHKRYRNGSRSCQYHVELPLLPARDDHGNGLKPKKTGPKRSR